MPLCQGLLPIASYTQLRASYTLLRVSKTLLRASYTLLRARYTLLRARYLLPVDVALVDGQRGAQVVEHERGALQALGGGAPLLQLHEQDAAEPRRVRARLQLRARVAHAALLLAKQ